MMVYPDLGDIELKWRASRSGVCVIVEGQTEQEDPWFYNRWFGDRAREVTFFPQDGWEKVAAAVASLRHQLGARKVYGIIDRDFETQIAYDPFPADGLLRTRKYTLENYLLDPRCWFSVAQPFTRREAKPGWGTELEVQATVETFYRACIPVSAYNWTLRQARDRDYAAFKALPEKDRRYLLHPRALQNLDVPARLGTIKAQMGIPDDPSQVYSGRLAYLQTLTLAELEQVVTGKAVLALLREDFPLQVSGKRAWDDMLGAYVHTCPAPPTDLKTLIDLIVQDACV